MLRNNQKDGKGQNQRQRRMDLVHLTDLQQNQSLSCRSAGQVLDADPEQEETDGQVVQMFSISWNTCAMADDSCQESHQP